MAIQYKSNKSNNDVVCTLIRRQKNVVRSWT